MKAGEWHSAEHPPPVGLRVVAKCRGRELFAHCVQTLLCSRDGEEIVGWSDDSNTIVHGVTHWKLQPQN